MYHSGGDVDGGGGSVYVGSGGIWEISVPSVQFCCESKTTLKIIKSINWEREKGTARVGKEQGRSGQVMVAEEKDREDLWTFAGGPKFWTAFTLLSLCGLTPSRSPGLQWTGILALGSLVHPILYLSRLESVSCQKSWIHCPWVGPAFSRGHPGTHSPSCCVWASGLLS